MWICGFNLIWIKFNVELFNMIAKKVAKPLKLIIINKQKIRPARRPIMVCTP